MEKIFTNKSIWKKIVVAVLIVMAFQAFISVPVVHAEPDEAYGEDDGDALGWGGVLLKPLMSLLVTVGDGIMEIMHSAIMGTESTLLHVDLTNDWLETIVKIIIVAVAAVALIATLGGSAVVSGLVIAAVAGSLFGLNVVPLAEGALNNAASAVCSTIYGDHTPGDLYLPAYTYTPEEIFKGRIKLFNVDFFNSGSSDIQVCYDVDDLTDVEKQNEGTQSETGKQVVIEEGKKGQTSSVDGYKDMISKDANPNRYHVAYYFYEDSNGKIIKTSAQDSAALLTSTISKWYVAIRNICIVAMLSVLVYVGIRMMLTTVSNDKAKYKEMLKDWLVGICLLFIMHYIMAFTVTVVQKFTDMVATAVDETLYAKVLISDDGNNENDLGGKPDSDKAEKFKEAMKEEGLEEYVHDGNGNWIWWTNLMGHLRLSMQFDKISGKYIGEAICFLALVIYTVVFTFTYLKRLLYMAFLTIISPFVALTYCIDKVNDGQAQGFNTWLKEYIFNLLIQPLHLMLYYILVTSAIDLAGKNVIYSLVAIGFMLPAEKLLRSLFGFQKAHTPPLLGGPLGATLFMQGFNKLTGGVAGGRLGKGEKGGNSQSSNSGSSEENMPRIEEAPGLGSVLAGGEPTGGTDNEGMEGQTSGGDVNLNNRMPSDNEFETDEQPTPTIEDLDQEQQELYDLRNSTIGEEGQDNLGNIQAYWEMQEDLNRRRAELMQNNNSDDNNIRTAELPEELEDTEISPWAMNARNLYDGVVGDGNRTYTSERAFNNRARLEKAKGTIRGARGAVQHAKRAGRDAYSKFDKNMNHLAPKHWRRAKIAGNIAKNIGKNTARTAGGMATGAIAAAPLVGAALAGGIASGDPSKGATAVGAALAAGSAVGRRASNARASDFVSPEVREAINEVDNDPRYKEQRMERHIKNLRKDEQINRTLESMDKDSAREMMDNGHFDEYVKLGYSTDRKGLQEMIASEKLIKDTSSQTRNINTTRAAAAVRDTYTRMGKAPSEMKDKDRKEWHKTHTSNYSAYGDRAESMAEQTMNLAQMFYDSMPE